MTSLGSSPNLGSDSGKGIGGVLGSIGSFVKDNVIDNESVRGAVSGVGDSIKRNASLQDDSLARKSIGAIGGILGKVKGGGSENSFDSTSIGTSTKGGLSEDDEAFFAAMAAKSGGGHGNGCDAGGNGSSFPGFGNSDAVSKSDSKNGFAGTGAAKKTEWGFDGCGDGPDFGGVKTPEKTQNNGSKGESTGGWRCSCGMLCADEDKKCGMCQERRPHDHNSAANASPSKPAPVLDTPPAPAPKAKAKLEEPDDFFASFGV